LSDKHGALHAFQSAVKIDPDNVDAWLNFSNVAELCEDLALSKSAAMNAAERFPENGRVQARLGAILTRSGSTKEALVPLSLAIFLSPLDAEPYLHAAIAYTATGDEQAAENSIRKCLLIMPDKLAPYPHLVELLKDKELKDNATTGLGWALRAARVAPTDARLWAIIGKESLRCQNVDNSIIESQRALVLDPVNSIATFNLPKALLMAGRYLECRAFSYRGITVPPHEDALYIIASEAERALGNIEIGWKHYDVRRTAHFGSERIGLPPFWEGDGDPGHLLVAAEQGIGDEYIFLSFLPQLMERCSKVTVECDKRNLALFGRTFPNIDFVERQVIGRENADPYFDYRRLTSEKDFDCAILAGSLPSIFIKDVSRPGPYQPFHVDPVERQFWRERFLGMDAGPWVGLCWRSGVGGAGRSQHYSRVEDVVRALGAGTANYVNLVYDLQPEELDAARKLDGCIIYDPENIDQKNELDRVAALLSALDAVVSVSTAIASLSASVGTPTLLLSCSHLRLSDGHDAILGASRPMLDKLERLDIDVSLQRAGRALPEILESSLRGKQGPY
jgi:Tfp pilus assembly protein PilF